MASPTPLLLPLLLAWAIAPGPDEVVFRFQDPAVVESSGLVVQDGRFVTVNDSGNPPLLFRVDPASGGTTDTVQWGEQNVDAEALAPAPGGGVWVGDIGDNDQERETISVTVVGFAGDADPTAYRLSYPDGSHDAETLLAHPDSGRLLVVTKGLLGGEVYAAPEVLDPREVNPLESIGRVLGLATDGAFFPDGRHLILRDYGRAVVYGFPGLAPVGEFDLPAQPQGEALAVSADEAIYVSSEGAGTPVYRVDLPDSLRRAMSPEQDPASSSAQPSDPSQEPSAEPPSQPAAQPSEAPGERGPWTWAIIVVAVVGATAGLGVRHLRRGRR